MVQSAPASEIAALILRGFDDYREQFREITDGARARFEQAQWQEAQRASAQRINLYEEKVAETVAGLRAGLADSELLDVERWPIIKSAYIAQIDLRLDDELAETWFNSIFCGLFSHDNISDGTMFVHTTRPSLRAHARAPYTRTYRPGGDLRQALEKIFDDYRFDVPYDDRERDLERIDALLHSNLPDWVCKDPDLAIELIGSVFYRNKGAYLVGRLFTPDEQWPLVFPLLHREGHGIQFDTVITDEAEVSIIFSFTRSYFMVDVPVPAELVAFLKRLLPGKHLAELYTSIGFYKQGKSEFYRALINHLATTDDRFVMAPGVRGMVMSVFTLPGFNTVFKIIKDRFNPSKSVDHATVIQKYQLVKNHDRVGRLADTQQFADFRFPVSKFEPECLAELLEVAPSTVVMEGDVVLIRHCWTERRMTPLNIYLENASEAQTREALNDYGLAIKQLAAANIFPGDMLLKNFGVTRHGRVVFYDYDEICYLTEVNFRYIPEPRFPEDEMSSEPWYSVGPNDVFPEEFPRFLFVDLNQRRLFAKLHGNLYDAVFAQGIEGGAAGGTVAGQAAAEGGVVAARVVYRAAQRGQRPGRVAAGVELQAGEPGFRQHVLQAHTFGDAAPGAVGLVDLGGAAQLAFQAVAGDVRRGDQAVRGQFGVGLRFAFPDVQRHFQVGAAFEQAAQGLVVDHRATAGVDQPGAGTQGGQAGFIQQVAGRVFAVAVQRSVQADHVGLGQQPFQRDEFAVRLARLARRIADQHFPAQPAQHLHQPPADLPGADHPIGAFGQVGAAHLGHRQQAAEHVVHHPAGVAAGCAGPGDAGLGEVVEVEVVGADGAGADEAHRRAGQRGAADLGDRAHQQHVDLGQRRAVDGAPGQAANGAMVGEEGVDHGNVFIGENTHADLRERGCTL